MGFAALVLRERGTTPYGGDAEAGQDGAPRDEAADSEAADAEARAADSGAADPHPFPLLAASEPAPGDVDAIEALGDSVALMAAHLHAGMYPYLVGLARFDRVEGWKIEGHRSCAHWVSYRTGNDLVTAREHARVARALEDLPEIGAAMARGALSFSQVRALTRVARPETETDLVELAEGCTVSQLERMVRAWRTSNRLDEAERERVRHESRTFVAYPDEEGMCVGYFRLDPEVGAKLMRAVEAASDVLYRERSPMPVGPAESQRQAAQRRADAIDLVAERALAAGFGAEDPKTLSGSRADRTQVVLHVEPETLEAEGEPGMSELEDGTRVSRESSRRLSCDASLVRVTRAPDGQILNVGRRTRTVPPAVRRALEVRDRGCRFPGCGLRFTDAHHVVHWADGGDTSLQNTVLLCGHHHRLLHEGGWAVEWWGPDRRAAFRDPRGQLHVGRPPKPPGLEADPVQALVNRNHARGARPDPLTATPRWRYERDIPDAVYFRAVEAGV